MKKYLFMLVACLICSCKSNKSLVNPSNGREPVYVINGVIFGNNEKEKDIVCALNPNYIENITVLKGKEVQRYNPRIKNEGAIIIDLKSRETVLKEKNTGKLNKLLSPQQLKIEDVHFYINGKEAEKEEVLRTDMGETTLKTGEDGKPELYISTLLYLR